MNCTIDSDGHLVNIASRWGVETESGRIFPCVLVRHSANAPAPVDVQPEPCKAWVVSTGGFFERITFHIQLFVKGCGEVLHFFDHASLKQRRFLVPLQEVNTWLFLASPPGLWFGSCFALGRCFCFCLGLRPRLGLCCLAFGCSCFSFSFSFFAGWSTDVATSSVVATLELELRRLRLVRVFFTLVSSAFSSATFKTFLLRPTATLVGAFFFPLPALPWPRVFPFFWDLLPFCDLEPLVEPFKRSCSSRVTGVKSVEPSSNSLLVLSLVSSLPPIPSSTTSLDLDLVFLTFLGMVSAGWSAWVGWAMHAWTVRIHDMK